MALIVVSGHTGTAGGVWLFRPRTRWPGASDAVAVVDPILADDAATAAGPTRRSYPYGGLLPEIGWVNRFQRKRSLGLDGWVRVAGDELTTSRGEKPGWSRAPLADAQQRCGPLDPPAADPARVCALAPTASSSAASLCAGACGAHAYLTELVIPDPSARWAPARVRAAPARIVRPAARRHGEILAQGEFVPGRASPLYAPPTPPPSCADTRPRGPRPRPGRVLPPDRAEASGEKVEGTGHRGRLRTQALVARASSAPIRAGPPGAARRALHGAACRGIRAHALLGHARPPTLCGTTSRRWAWSTSCRCRPTGTWRDRILARAARRPRRLGDQESR